MEMFNHTFLCVFLKALHWAASGGHYDAIEFLIQKGAKVDVVAKDGDTPLHKVMTLE